MRGGGYKVCHWTSENPLALGRSLVEKLNSQDRFELKLNTVLIPLTNVVEKHNKNYDEVDVVFKDILFGLYGCPSNKYYSLLDKKKIRYHLARIASETPGNKPKYVN